MSIKGVVLRAGVIFALCTGIASASGMQSLQKQAVPLSGFLNAGGHFDLDKAQRKSFEGMIDMQGFQMGFDRLTGEPLFLPLPVTEEPDDPTVAVWDREADRVNFTIINGRITGLLVYDGKLVVAGHFSLADGQRANNIAVWDGVSWSTLGRFGMNESVNALAVYEGRLIAGGEFTTAGGDIVDYVALWDGNFWCRIGDGLTQPVHCLGVRNGQLVAVGLAFTGSGKCAEVASAWDGSNWTYIQMTDLLAANDENDVSDVNDRMMR